MDQNGNDIVVPVVAEELHVDAVPVPTGGVRVTKRVETHEETVAQQLRKTHVDIRRVKMERVVDGPQPARRVGNTLIVPVVSEVLHVQKQWVVTEEIHITETEELATAEQAIELKREVPSIERLDQHGTVVSSPEETTETTPEPSVRQHAVPEPTPPRKVLSRTRSMLKK